MCVPLLRTERKEYYAHREIARSDPSNYLSIIIDGMDQQKTCIPYMVPEAKTTQHLPWITAHITGVLVHTQCSERKIALAFADNHEWPHDSNLTINVLNETLEYMSSRYERVRHNSGSQ